MNETMFIVDPFRPATGQFVLQRLWLTNATEWIALRFLDEANNSQRVPRSQPSISWAHPAYCSSVEEITRRFARLPVEVMADYR